MDLNKMLMELLSTTELPVSQDENVDGSEKYIIFIYEDENPEYHADNKVSADTAYLQIQLITPKKFNYFPLKKEIRNLLEGAGFAVTSIKSFLGNVAVGTEKIRQTIFETNYTEIREENE